MNNKSIWLDNIKYKANDSLNKNITVDVLIIGGGISGISTAYHLKDSNLKVCLVEKNEIGHGVTSKTTGKLTYLQELIYTKLKKYHSVEKSKLYLRSQLDAIDIVKKIINENNIKCNLEKNKSYVFTNQEKEVKKIKLEKELLEKFNINVDIINNLPDNNKVLYGICVDNTYTFHPLKYLYELKKVLNKKVDIYENTKIEEIKKQRDYYICNTKSNIIKAKHVVFATHYPYFIIPYLLPLKTHLEKSYIAAFKSKNCKYNAITSNKPTISIRYYDDYKIYLNGSHNLCLKNNEKENFNNLLNEIVEKPDYIWSNKDIITSDYLPYIGLIKENMYISTGYNTWGMTNGTIAGKIISDLILKKDNNYIELFNPNRNINLAKIINFPINISSSIKSFVGTKINKRKDWYSNVEFKMLKGKSIGIYKDSKEHIVYNKCPHMKCSLIFNEIEKTWDCPCHGSRFDLDGKCIEGPSNYNITYKK